jgi:hypothetical protein
MSSDPAQRPIDPDPDEVDKSVRAEPVDTVHGEVTVAQQPTGDRNMVGGGEFPDPDTPASLHDPAADPSGDDEEVVVSDGTRRPRADDSRRSPAD